MIGSLHYQVDSLNLDHTNLKTRVVVGGARQGWIDWGQLYDQVSPWIRQLLPGFLMDASSAGPCKT